MKISLNAIKRQGYEDIFKLPVDQLAVKIGAQLGALEEEPRYLGAIYEGILVAKVVAAQKHSGADKLSVCKIDDGGESKQIERDEAGHIQVVCGAPNVREGMLVAWIPPGVAVPATVDKEPLVLEARDIRGEKSNGMLASPSELGISDDHDGLLEVASDDVGEDLAKPGTPFKQLYGLDDYILDIENKMFTHRPDCFGLLGVGREIAGIQNIPFHSPEWYRDDVELLEIKDSVLKVTVQNELPTAVPRFVAVPLSNVSVKPSPVWLQSFLSRMGLRPINNVVDLTNYYMLLTGQPLHAYDYDKVVAQGGGDGAVIVIRNPRPSEKLKLLNGKVIDPRQEAIMIATDKQLIGVGGVMGGSDTEVDESTKNVILECANFDMYSIRRTSMAHGLFTDAVSRFNKGQSPLQNLAVALKAADDFAKITGAHISGKIIDDNHLDEATLDRGSVRPAVTVSRDFINSRLGVELPVADMRQILENVEFKVAADGGDLIVKSPFWRTDVELREDVVEEVGRLHGYDQLPLVLPRRNIAPAVKDALFEAKARIRQLLSQAGANELLTYSFVHGNLLDKVGQSREKAYQISNALSPDLQYYRMSLVPSLLEKVHPNIKAGYDEFALFEIGKTHSTDHVDADGLPEEFEVTALVVAAVDKLNKPGAAFYLARKYLTSLTPGVDLEYKPLGDIADDAIARPYTPERSAAVYVGGQLLGVIGEFKPSVSRSLKLPNYCAGLELDNNVLLPILSTGQKYTPLSRFPGIKQDITLRVAADVDYRTISELISKQLQTNSPERTYSGQKLLDIFQAEQDPAHIHYTFRITLTGLDRTLTEEVASKLLDTIAAQAKSELNAERI